MQRRNIAEPDNPFGIARHIIAQPIEQMHGAITATTAQNSLHPGVVKRLAKIVEALVDGARIHSRLTQAMRRNNNAQLPACEPFGSAFHISGIDHTGRRDNGDTVAGD